MDIKFIKKNLSIIIIMTIIITGIMVPRSKATDALEPGKTLLNYTDVDVKTEPGKELRIIMPNYENTVIDKVKIAGKEQALIKDQKAKKLFIMYTGEAGKVTLEFYKEKAKEPFVIRQMEIKKEKDGTYSAVIDPQITYSSETKKDKTFLIRDGSGIKEIIICKRNAKGSYDYKKENIIFRNAESNERKDSNYTDTKLTELGKRAEIKIKKQDEYGYYEIKVTSTSGLIHKREVKVSGKMSSPETKAKNENGFAPSIKADKTNPDKITFSIDKSDKVTSAKMYPIIDGKISKSAILDIDKKSGYVTSFTFAKEGMFRLVLLNKAGEKVASSTDFIISRKNNSDEWRINESPRVTRSSKKDDIQNVKISDGAIKTIKIFIKENGKYNLKEPIYIYENGSVTLTTPNYIDEEKSNYKDTKNIYIALRRVSANHRYLIQVTDKGGNDPELIRNKLFFVKKGKASKKSTKSTKPKAAKAQNTNNTNTNGTAPDNTVDPNTVNDTNTNGATTGNTVDPNTVNDTNTNGATTGNTVDQNTVNDTNTNGTAPDNTVDQNTANSANQNETKPEVKVEKPKLTWNDDKKQLTVEIKEKSAKIKKVNLGNLKKYFTKVKKSSNDYKYVYNTTKLAKDKKNYTVKVTYENGKTAKSNKVTVKMADQKPTIKFNKETKELTVTDKDGIKSAKVIKNSQYIKEPGKRNDDGTQMVFKMKRDTNGKKTLIIVRVKDKYERTEETDKCWIPKTRKTKKSSSVVVNDKDVKYWNSNGKKTTTSSSKKTTASSSKKTTTSSSKKTTANKKSEDDLPTLQYFPKKRRILVTDRDGIRSVGFNGIWKYIHKNRSLSGKTTWVYDVDSNADYYNKMMKLCVNDGKHEKKTNKVYITTEKGIQKSISSRISGNNKPTITLTNGGKTLEAKANSNISQIIISRNGSRVKSYYPNKRSFSRSVSSLGMEKQTRHNDITVTVTSSKGTSTKEFTIVSSKKWK